MGQGTAVSSYKPCRNISYLRLCRCIVSIGKKKEEKLRLQISFQNEKPSKGQERLCPGDPLLEGSKSIW